MRTTTMQQALKLSCTKCNYNLTVTEGLMPWAETVMTRHFEAQHQLTAKELKEKEK